MNDHLPSPRREPTQAAEGMPRWRWTLAEFERFIELGILTEDDRVELIGGEIVPMASIGRRHELVADELHQTWAARYDAGFRVTTERQLNLNDDTYTKPDLWVRPAPVLAADIRGDTVLLVVEIAASSLAFDLGVKAATTLATASGSTGLSMQPRWRRRCIGRRGRTAMVTRRPCRHVNRWCHCWCLSWRSGWRI